MSYESRTGAVLFAKSLDRVAAFYSNVLGLREANRDDDHILLESPGFQLVVHRITGGGSAAGEITVPPARRGTAAFKPVFFVPGISPLRAIAEAHGGVMEPPEREWSFNGVTVCDGLDPEGNVIQFRQQT
jgi:catechol 2,3-dioxygenase-like lactoylglutathione lyase family enzyme